MDKLVKKVDFLGYTLYVYGEADVESNLKMQKPLKKLYEYENQNDRSDKNVRSRRYGKNNF